jgi:hypothetical protein
MSIEWEHRQTQVRIQYINPLKRRGAQCSVLLTQYCAGDKIEKNEMGGLCGTYGGVERPLQGFGGENLREKGNFVGSCVDGKIILRWIVRKWDMGSWTGSSWLMIGTVGSHL